MKARPTAMLLLLVGLSLSHLAPAYPDYWVQQYLDRGSVAGATCITHPTAATLNRRNHPVPSSANPGITFALKDAQGATVSNSRVCPGQTYSLTVGFPGGQNHLFLTSTLANSLTVGSTPDGCDGSRIYTAFAKASYTTPLAVPSTAGACTGCLVVALSCSTGQGNNINQNQVALSIADSKQCAKPTPSPSPSPPASDAAAADPSPSAVESTNTSLSLSPSPAPGPLPTALPNYTGPCASTGACAICASETTCFACEADGYVLTEAGKCDCAPGYGASYTVADSNISYMACKRCNASHISPGGNAQQAVCSSCQPLYGEAVPNREQSLCLSANAWPQGSGDVFNRRWASEETRINSTSIQNVTKAWAFAIDGDVSATPMVYNGRVYFPTWAGSVFCLNASDGAVVWKQSIEALLNASGVAINETDQGYIVSRTSMAYAVVGAQARLLLGTMRRNIGGYPFLLALDPATGSLVWKAQLDTHPAALITQSATVYRGYAYVGVSSMEEARASDLNYTCCSFVGSFAKVNVTDGTVAWTWRATPGQGWSGASVWGSSPAIDTARGRVYFATGDNYMTPQAVETCLTNLGNLTDANVAQQLECERLSGGDLNFRNSVVALDTATGALVWGKKLGGPDAWNAACFQVGHPNCPKVAGPDYDFGQAPMLLTACRADLGCKQLLAVGQKAGIVWGLLPETGAVAWWNQVGPGGVIGGMMWGSATDGQRVYVSNNNYFHLPLDAASLKIVNAGFVASGGLVSALDPWDGSVLWTFANPMPQISNSQQNALSQAPVTVANGVVFYGSMDATGVLFFLNAATGQQLGSYAVGASLASGVSIVNGNVYTGSGYNNFGLGNTGQSLTALTVNPGPEPMPKIEAS